MTAAEVVAKAAAVLLVIVAALALVAGATYAAVDHVNHLTPTIEVTP